MVARLLGVRLLTLEGTVVLSPAELRDFETGPQRPIGARSSDAHRRENLEPAASPAADARPADEHAIGTRLATAEQMLANCSETFRELDRAAD